MKTESSSPGLTRRDVVKTLALASAAIATDVPARDAPAPPRLLLGIDNFAVRAFGWDADQLIDYASKLQVDSLFISDLKPFKIHDDAYLTGLRKRATDLGLRLYLGSWSICPTSVSFRKDWGTAEEHLALGIRMAKALGSPVFRCILGNGRDRLSEGGIRARIADTVKVLKAQRSRALDAGVTIAVENHAGDMQGHELVDLIEAAGPDYVGANLDPGNAAWTLEDPVVNLEIVGKHTACTSVRDTMVWTTDDGAAARWTAMGEGVVDWEKYFRIFAKLCPHVPVHVETISQYQKPLPFHRADFWKPYPEARGSDLAAFIAMAKKGKPIERYKPPKGANRQEAQRAYQKSELERSLAYCRETLGLGVRGR
jgi:3-oxoisoapionate decarboxylase